MEEKAGLFILLLANAAVSSFRDPDVVCSPKPVKAAVSEDATLLCRLDPQLDATNMTVEWSNGRFNRSVYLHPDTEDTRQREQLQGRASLDHQQLIEGNLSLKLSAVQLSDAGTYRCSISAGELQSSCYVSLAVEADSEGSAQQFDDSRHKIYAYVAVGALITIVLVFVAVVTKCDYEAICDAMTCLTACVESIWST